MIKKLTFDLAVVGSGIAGSFAAFHALQKGLKVALIEKDNYPAGASVRNFGQCVPSGQSIDKWRPLGLKSLEFYTFLSTLKDAPVKAEGSTYVASDDGEMRLLEELHQIDKKSGYTSELLTVNEVLNLQPTMKPEQIKGGLHYPQEVSLNPVLFLKWMIDYLKSLEGFSYFPNTHVISCQDTGKEVEIETLNDELAQLFAKQVLIFPGSETGLLFPEVFHQEELLVSKLQMLKIQPPEHVVVKGNVLTGYSIRRYEAFKSCPSWNEVGGQFKNQKLQSDLGIHILAKQEADGSIILGDSHQYATVKQRHLLDYRISQAVNETMLNEINTMFDFGNYTLTETWTGTYLTHPDGVYIADPDKHIRLITAFGGKGMTVAPGFTYEQVNKLF